MDDLALPPIVCLATERLALHPGVTAVALLGSLGAYGAIDAHSDIDLAVFVERRQDGASLPPFSFWVPHEGGLVEVNLSQHALEDERPEHWDAPRRQAYARARIVFDRDARLRSLVATARASAAPGFFSRLVACLNQARWRAQHHAACAHARGEPEAAHQLATEGAWLCVEGTFLVNRVEPPHTKWALREAERLPWTPLRLRARMGEALRAPDFELRTLDLRRAAIATLVADIGERARATIPNWPDDPYEHWFRHLSRRQLFAETPVDRICRPLEGVVSREMLQRIRGAVSLACLSGLGPGRALLDLVAVDGLVDDASLALLQSSLVAEPHHA